MQILITGADGFIGKNLQLHLSERKDVQVGIKGTLPLFTLTRPRFTTFLQPAPGKTPSLHAGNIKCLAVNQLSHKVLPNCGTRDMARAAIFKGWGHVKPMQLPATTGLPANLWGQGGRRYRQISGKNSLQCNAIKR